MSSAGTILGALVQYDIPRWEPLYDLVGVDLADWFMWMCEIELADGSRVHAYKHIATRRYFHLAEDGRVFAYTRGGRYTETPPRHAIDAVFDGWEELRPEPEDPAAVRDALRRARLAAACGRPCSSVGGLSPSRSRGGRDLESVRQIPGSTRQDIKEQRHG